MTVEQSIETALFSRARALTLPGAPRLAWPNVNFDPPPGPYVRVQHLPNVNTRIFAKGSAPHLRQGILQFTVVTPLNAGAAAAMSLAGAIAVQFPADLDFFEDGVRVRIQSAPDIALDNQPDVTYDALVTVKYEAFA